MTEHDLSTQPPTDGKPATEAPVVAGAGQTFDDLDSTTPLTADAGQNPDPAGETTGGADSEEQPS
ncbi:MAG TPA: hypothetical protein VGX49_00890 [Jatrophihabitans sp.]|jgi:hypothetical protein|nr:hypothetical protein [Jatrophihabitans sp.]